MFVENRGYFFDDLGEDRFRGKIAFGDFFIEYGQIVLFRLFIHPQKASGADIRGVAARFHIFVLENLCIHASATSIDTAKKSLYTIFLFFNDA